ncbi:hypothetical protein EW146_g6511 [Bondarzewia mesenterica]|uniref:Very-long-chain (3R)-3-hydroxyacyl-CoA dehydratase n=1 Tax=Bondarzewia mesenterica TaxID=1095465 RepID=A0A4S4LQ91_9AGAM|nr:hypothetical protein EW146_g6511 [Bondarzewia mesenterica]
MTCQPNANTELVEVNCKTWRPQFYETCLICELRNPILLQGAEPAGPEPRQRRVLQLGLIHKDQVSSSTPKISQSATMSQQHPPITKKKPTPPLVKGYLVLYNLLSAAGWSYVLYLTLIHLWSPTVPASASIPSFIPTSLVPLYKRATSTFTAVGEPTFYVQSLAILEILHALLGFVRSPLTTTAMQVASRLYLVWYIAARFDSVSAFSFSASPYFRPSETLAYGERVQARASPFYGSMVLSWSVTEVIRYTFYASSLVGIEPRVLVWLRYTTFYVLYITGASSEAFVAFFYAPAAKARRGVGRRVARPCAVVLHLVAR